MDDPNKGPQTAVDREVIQVLADNETLKTQNADLLKRLEDTEKSLRAANDLIDSHTRGNLIAKIKEKSDYGVEYLSTRTADQLREIIQHMDHTKAPTMLIGADMPGEVKKETLGDMYGTWKKV